MVCVCYNAITVLSQIWKIIWTISESGQWTIDEYCKQGVRCIIVLYIKKMHKHIRTIRRGRGPYICFLRGVSVS